MNIFFLFIYHQEECYGRERKCFLMFLMFLIPDKFQYWCFLFLPQVSVLFLKELFLIKQRVVLVCFKGECPGSARYLLHQPWEK